MKSISIKHISCENYKGIKKFDSDMFNRTMISGKNAVGKSTLMDICFDILTGKMADGTSADNVRPHDKDGIEIPRVSVVRSIAIEIDGKEHFIEKWTEQKWRKPRGSVEEVFDGNVTFYKVDGFDMKQKEYTKWVSENIGEIETLVFCLNSTPFLNLVRKSTADARKMIEKLSGFSLEKFIEEHNEFSEIAEITKGHQIEDVKKQLVKQINLQKKSVERVRENLAYEENRELDYGDVNVEELKKQITVHENECNALVDEEKRIEESSKEFNDLSAQLIGLNYKREDIKKSLLKEHDDKKVALENALRQLKLDYASEQRMGNAFKSNKNELEIDLSLAKSNLARDTAFYKSVSSQTYDSRNNTCMTCGQPLPKKKIEELVSAFETKKKNDIESAISRGKLSKEQVSKIEARIKVNEESIKEHFARVDSLNKKIAQATKEYEEYPAVDLSDNKELSDITAKIDDVFEKLKTLDNGFARKKEIAEEKIAITNKINVLRSTIDSCEKEKELKIERINELHAMFDNEISSLAKLERQLDLITSFSKAKNDALTESVNKYFDFITIKLFDTTLEGNIFETFKIVVDGTDYFNGLNHGAKILSEMDLVKGISEMSGFKTFVIADDTESLDGDKIPNFDRQLIVLRRTDEQELTVKEC